MKSIKYMESNKLLMRNIKNYDYNDVYLNKKEHEAYKIYFPYVAFSTKILTL